MRCGEGCVRRRVGNMCMRDSIDGCMHTRRIDVCLAFLAQGFFFPGLRSLGGKSVILLAISERQCLLV